MPSSLTWSLPRTLVCSTHPPVSVCGTVRRASTRRRLFSAAWPARLRPAVSGGDPPGASPGDPHFQPGARAAFRVTAGAPRAGCRNVRLPSIGYASRPGLRDRLTPGGRAWPGKPRICGGGDSHPPCRYSCLHGLPHALQGPSRDPFDAHAALSYHPRQGRGSATSATRLSPDHFRRGATRPVGCYAVFK